MALVRKMLRQKAVWWRKTGTKNKFGQDTFDAPQEIACRWENRVGQFFNARGESNDSKATVYVGSRLQVGDVLMEGELESWVPNDPKGENDALPIKAFDSIPSLKNNPNKTLYVAHL